MQYSPNCLKLYSLAYGKELQDGFEWLQEVKTLANIKSAIKRAELNVKQNEKNSAQKSALRTAIKAFNANPTEEAYRAASASIDKAASKGLIHKNKASRDKSRLAAKLAN